MNGNAKLVKFIQIRKGFMNNFGLFCPYGDIKLLK